MGDNQSFGRTKTSISRPPFVVDDHSIMRDTGRQIDWSLLTDRYRHGAFAVQANGVSAQGATALTVDAIAKALPKGSVLQFGVDEYARLTADAAAGAVSLAVEALPNAIEDNDVAWANPGGTKNGFYVPAGEEMDLLASGKVVPSALGTGGVTCYGLLMTAADEASKTDAATGYGIITQGQIYENLLPNATGSPKVIDSTLKTELLNRGGAWMFMQYSDNT